MRVFWFQGAPKKGAFFKSRVLHLILLSATPPTIGRMTGYGVNENGEPYVDFEAWNLDLITDEFISDREEYTITFKCTTDDYCPRWTTKK